MDMSLVVRAFVTREEKQAVVDRFTELGITESELIRRGLTAMGVRQIAEKKKPGPKGPRYSEETAAAVRRDYAAGATWEEIMSKHNLGKTAISKIIGNKRRNKKRTETMPGE